MPVEVLQDRPDTLLFIFKIEKDYRSTSHLEQYVGAPQGIEIASANEFHEFTSLSGSEAASSHETCGTLRTGGEGGAKHSFQSAERPLCKSNSAQCLHDG